jgi:hypothetical protein
VRKVSAILRSKTCDCKVACAPCYAPEGCADNEFFASGSKGGTPTNFLGGVTSAFARSSTYTGCVSYEDSLNKATYQAALSWQSRVLVPSLDTWTAIRSNEEISATVYCPCGWIGDPVTVTIPAGTYTNYWTIAEANLAAYNDALSQAEALQECTPP